MSVGIVRNVIPPKAISERTDQALQFLNIVIPESNPLRRTIGSGTSSGVIDDKLRPQLGRKIFSLDRLCGDATIDLAADWRQTPTIECVSNGSIQDSPRDSKLQSIEQNVIVGSIADWCSVSDRDLVYLGS